MTKSIYKLEHQVIANNTLRLVVQKPTQYHIIIILLSHVHLIFPKNTGIVCYSASTAIEISDCVHNIKINADSVLT